MPDAPSSTFGGLPSDADAAVGELYLRHARALHDYVERLCPDPASADDIMQETFIRAWHHLPRLRAEDRPIRPWLLRVARNLLIDAGRAARSRPVTVRGQLAEQGCADSGLDRVLDRQLVTGALRQLSPAHRTVLVETFYCDSTLATIARRLGYPTARPDRGCTTACGPSAGTCETRARPPADDQPPAPDIPHRAFRSGWVSARDHGILDARGRKRPPRGTSATLIPQRRQPGCCRIASAGTHCACLP